MMNWKIMKMQCKTRSTAESCAGRFTVSVLGNVLQMFIPGPPGKIQSIEIEKAL